MRKLLIAACAVALTPGAALAQYPPFPHPAAMRPRLARPHFAPGAGPGRFGPGPAARFAAGPTARFGARDMAAWRGGYWWHGWRGGRIGWWWGAGGYWYWYATPAYPYPDAVADYSIPDPHAVVAETWWYCDNPPGYYPYVRGCQTPWRPAAVSAHRYAP